MTFDAFKDSTDEPLQLSTPLRALWQEANGDWEKAHTTLQHDESADAAWVHAYLHRKEGNSSNARHWYARAEKPEPRESLDQEWEQITRALLKQQAS